MKKSFSLLEIIFVIIIISILVSFIVSFTFSSLIYKSNIKNIKVELALIRTVINKNHNKKLLIEKKSLYVDVLDTKNINVKNEFLFTGNINNILLTNIIKSSSQSEKKEGSWIKTNKNSYRIFLNKKSVDFIYNNKNGNFDCDIKQSLCKELIQ